MSDIAKISVIDPGLYALGGHHAALALYIAETQGANRDWVSASIFSHMERDREVEDKIRATGCELIPFFETNFYENYGRKVGVASHGHYIHGLALEYRRLIAVVNAASIEGPDILVYHTMNWDHLTALGLAIRASIKTRVGAGIRHIVCMMFNPGVDFLGNVFDLALAQRFRAALNLLDTSNVHCYASCIEYAREYAYIGGTTRSIDIHPCFLDDWRRSIRVTVGRGFQDKHSHIPIASMLQGRTLLYIGDAKLDKGFASLPRLVKWLLPMIEPNASLVVQYTIHDWADQDVMHAAQALEALAERDARVEVYSGFWENERLHECLGHVDLLIFPYDRHSYRDKSSGVLWLAAWYKIPMIFLHASWLSREAIRLGAEAWVVDDWRYPKNVRPCHSGYPALNYDFGKKAHSSLLCEESILSYRGLIYRSFWTWMKEDIVPLCGK